MFSFTHCARSERVLGQRTFGSRANGRSRACFGFIEVIQGLSELGIGRRRVELYLSSAEGICIGPAQCFLRLFGCKRGPRFTSVVARAETELGPASYRTTESFSLCPPAKPPKLANATLRADQIPRKGLLLKHQKLLRDSQFSGRAITQQHARHPLIPL